MDRKDYRFWSVQIKEKALRLGFEYVGISNAEILLEEKERVEQWLSEGYQAEMHYLENNKEKRYDPSKLFEGTKSVVTVLLNYYPERILDKDNNYKIAKYAYGKDYHFIIKDKLNLILDELKKDIPKLEGRAFTDSAPFLDRAWAKQSGLGFIGKNTCLINRKMGSFFLIGQLLLNIDLEYDSSEHSNYCGSCRRCIDACPTGALKDEFTIDSRKCISYLTIEYKGDLPQNLKNNFNDWIFGCDICQDVCPWNRFSKPHSIQELNPHPSLFDKLKSKKDWESLRPEEFGEIFRGSAVKRAKYSGLKRNIDFLAKES
ncbi:MAG: tRNA epoxyqueuosine(34) reductase QueG [Bacteroidales bacterium]